MIRQGDIRPVRALVSFLAVILVFLFVGDIALLVRERAMMLDEAAENTRNELSLVSALMEEALMKDDVSAVESAVGIWAGKERDIVEVQFVALDGSVLFEFRRPGSFTKVITVSTEVPRLPRGPIALRVVKDLAPIHAEYRSLLLQHIVVSLVFAAVTAAILWFTLRKTAFVPMERMLKEIRALNEELEERVEERTRELRETNEQLEDEIAKRGETESLLLHSQQHLRSIIENAPECIKLVAPDGTVLDMNPAGLEIIEAESREMVIGKPACGIVAEECCEDFNAFVKRVCSGGKEKLEFSVTGFRGTRKILESYAVPLYDAERRQVVMLALTRDVTEQRKMEEQLLHARKMEVMGKLTGGISHEFNNILTAILGYGEFLQDEIPLSSHLRRYIDNIMTSAQRATSLTRGLLAFSRKQFMTMNRIRANDLVEKMSQLLTKLIGEDITLVVRLTPEDTSFMGDAGQIEQVILNLATNARDAMPSGGTLILTTDRILLDEDFRQRYGYGSPGEHVVIAISDTGVGMDDSIRQKVFEPFFTTKSVGKGTGLGLSMVYGIVKQHSGYITVYSEPALGTTFKVFLPFAGDGADEQPGSNSAAMPEGGNETILVAEDDAEVRSYLSDTLRHAGYRVVEADNGDAAIVEYGRQTHGIAILIVDVVMPGKDGKAVFDELRRINPGVKVLFLSGYAGDIFQRKGFPEGVARFMSKPVSRPELLKAVRQILDTA